MYVLCVCVCGGGGGSIACSFLFFEGHIRSETYNE